MNREVGRASNYRDLVVWQKAMELCRIVYQVSESWPSTERFGLTSQLRRAAVSVPSNLAEGQGRFGKAEFARYVSIAHGSLCELETQLILANDFGYPMSGQMNRMFEICSEVGKMLRALHRTLTFSKINDKKDA